MEHDQERATLDDGAWFHGSPERLSVLRVGSTVTRSRPIAEAFSHRPTCLGYSLEAQGPQLCHNGALPGYLYVIAEEVAEADLHPHPNSSFPGGGVEWLTDRPLRLEMIGEVPGGEPSECGACPRRPKGTAEDG